MLTAGNVGAGNGTMNDETFLCLYNTAEKA